MRILAINPGSTSTKIAVFEDKKEIFAKTVNHKAEDLMNFKQIADQKDYRKEVIMEAMRDAGVELDEIDYCVGRGGLVRSLQSGVYRINDQYLQDASIGLQGQHASNLGGILAHELAKESKNAKDAFTVDPVVVDEYEDIARLSGISEISRVISFHPLNQKAVSRRYAKSIGKKYEDLNLIVAHLGGGISVGAHKNGRVIDVNAALGGDGPFSPERAGGVPPLPLIQMCFSGKYTYEEVYSKLFSCGGLYSYLGVKDLREVLQMIEKGNSKAELVFKAMAYQVAKEIGACAVALSGHVDAIILTGGMSHNPTLCELISERVGFITSEIVVYPGEDEMKALAEGVYEAVLNKREILTY
ncbi:butyrate kinase [Lentisphaerota bacterium ZTH]|nr:butyrate kinase [Lentisphaerota bacterium]WET05920.1 butyrate kinase [Lentisphaerota bacterium ZTH]